MSRMRRGPLPSATSFLAKASAPSSRSPCTISSTRPSDSAFSAGTELPLVIILMASAAPTTRGRRCVPPEPGSSPQLHLRQAELALRQRDAVVAAEREFEPAAERETADRRDHRLAEGVLRVVDLRQRGRHVHLRRVELADVGAAREGLRRADDHEGLHRGVGARLLDAVHQGRAQHAAQAVDRRIVHGDDGDAVADGIGCSVAHARVSGNAWLGVGCAPKGGRFYRECPAAERRLGIAERRRRGRPAPR